MTTSKESKQVIVDMLTENTGRHLLDSGGAYGRHWERNQAKPTIEDWEATDQVRLEVWTDDDTNEVKEFYPIISLYHWLVNHYNFTLEYREDLQTQLDKIGEDNPDQYYSDDIEMFLTQYAETNDITGLYGDNSRLCSSGYTYNEENSFSQDFIFHYFENEDTDERFVILQIHGGCDARGGFTAPKIFEVDTDDGAYWFHWNDCSIGDDSGNSWYFDGHSWEVGNVEGINNTSNQPELIDVKADYTKVSCLQDYTLYATENDQVISPIDGTVLSVGF
jgi:hypothetical protein